MSLFSFQDIMMAVMGVMILITLLMAVQLGTVIDQIADRQAPVQQPTPDALAAFMPAEALPPTVATRDSLTAQIAKQTQQRDQLLEKLHASGRDQPIVTPRELAELRQQLAEAEARLRDQQQQFEHASEAATQAKSDQQQALTARAGQLDLLEARVRRLREDVAREQASPRLTYLVQEGATRKAIVVEVTGTHLRVASADGQFSASFDTPDTSRRKRQFVMWTSTRNPATEYFLLIVKPSGIEISRELEETLRTTGFSLGRDFVPESRRVVNTIGP